MRAGPRGIWRWHWLLAGCIAVPFGASVQAEPAERLLPLAAVRPAARFSSADLRALQASDDANPAMLWVAQGQALWRTPAGASASCAGCHGDAAVSMRGVAARYPALELSSDPAAIAPARLLNLEGRINQCRSRHQGLAPWPVHLVDEGENRDAPHAAHLKHFAGLGLQALGRVFQHHRVVGGGQRAIGVF